MVWEKMILPQAVCIYMAVICTIFSAYVACLFALDKLVDSSKPPLFGSDQRLLDSLTRSEHGDSYKFLVLGDSRGNYPVEETLINPVAKEIEFDIAPESISHRFVYSPEDVDLSNWLEVRSMLHVIPFFIDHFILMYVLLFFVAFLWALLIFFLLRRIKASCGYFKRKPGQSSAET